MYLGLRIIDVSEPSNPYVVGVYPISSESMMVSGNYLYVASTSGLIVLDVTDPSNPTVAGYYQPYWYLHNIALRGNYVYADEGYYLRIYDCSDILSVKNDLKCSPSAEFTLLSPYPNPFNAQTTIAFTLPVASWVKLDVFDIAGRIAGAVREPPLHEGWLGAGTHHVLLDCSGLPSGIYIYRLRAGEFEAAGKMVLLK